jgi:hypothetical protein
MKDLPRLLDGRRAKNLTADDVDADLVRGSWIRLVFPGGPGREERLCVLRADPVPLQAQAARHLRPQRLGRHVLRRPRRRRPARSQLHREKTLEGQVTAANKGNHGGRPKVIDDDSLTFAIALKDKGVPVREIAKKLTIKSGKNAGKHPSVASLYRALSEADEQDAQTEAEIIGPAVYHRRSQPSGSPGALPGDLQLTMVS